MKTMDGSGCTTPFILRIIITYTPAAALLSYALERKLSGSQSWPGRREELLHEKGPPHPIRPGRNPIPASPCSVLLTVVDKFTTGVLYKVSSAMHHGRIPVKIYRQL